MADLISRAAAIDALKRAAYWNDAERKITELPTIDAIPMEWLKEQIAEVPDSLWASLIESVMNQWKKEQEEQDGKFR